MEPIDIPVAQVPESELHSFREQCWRYVLGFVVPEVQSAPVLDEIPRQAGTGTLVQTDAGLAILTAAHVADVLRKSGRFGIITRSPRITCHYYDASRFAFHTLGQAPYTSGSLDIAIIGIPPALRHAFERTTVALRLSHHLVSMSDAAFTPRHGLVGVFGFVDEFTRDLPLVDGVSGHKGFSLAGAVGISDQWCREQANDAISLEAERLTEKVPRSWRGVSGGGFWQVDVTQEGDGAIRLGNPVFCGVMFYEGDASATGRRLFAQGPAAIQQLVAASQAGGRNQDIL